MTARRILFHHRIRADDGQAVHVKELIAALREQGHEVLECALVPKADGTRGEDGGATSRWQRLRLPRWLTEALEIGYSRRGLAMLLKVAPKFRPDFIYERHALHCRAGALAAAHLGVPLLLEVNAPMTDEMARLGLLRFQRLARRSEHDVLGLADRVLAVSDVLGERLCELGAAAAKLRIIRNAADPSRHGDTAREQGKQLRHQLGLPATAFVVGFIGYMRSWHRLDLALAAMATPDLAHMHLMLAGHGPAAPELAAQAAQLGVQDRVHALGVVPAAQLPGVCGAFDVALVPAINEYASPLKVFDALAAGVATVAPDQPNLREIVDDDKTAVLFPPGDVSMLGKCLSGLAQDPARRHRIGAAGRQLLLDRDWTWAGNARRVIAAFTELTS
ncbi:MAG: glycosyltransferase family 4 protein [Planctomycetota bacterium]|jgi:glycosyltransferase involved in cell wall biosynthesis